MVIKKNLIKELDPNIIIPQQYGTVVVLLDFQNLNTRLIEKIERKCPGLTKDFTERVEMRRLETLTGWWITRRNSVDTRKMIFLNTTKNATRFSVNVLLSTFRDIFSGDNIISIILSPNSLSTMDNTALEKATLIDSVLSTSFRHVNLYYL